MKAKVLSNQFIYSVITCISLYSGQALATASYNKQGIAFDNPANLNFIPHKEIKTGVSLFNVNITSRGKGRQPATRSQQPQGENTTSQSDAMPYLRIASRLSPKWVVAFSVTHPWHFSQRFPKSSFTRYVPHNVHVRSLEYAGSASYQPFSWLALGAGAGYTRITTGEISGVFPGASDEPWTFRGQDWYWHWNVGFNVRPTRSTLIDGSFFSHELFKLDGHTDMNGASTSGTVRLDEPNIAQLNITQYLTRKWLVRAGTFWQGWGTRTSFTIPMVRSQTGLNDIRLVLNWHDTFTNYISTMYKVRPYFSVFAGLIDDHSPYPDATFSLGLPLPSVLVYTAGMKVDLQNGISLKTKLAHGVGNHNIKNANKNINGEQGSVDGTVNLATLELTFRFDQLEDKLASMWR